MTKPKTFVLCPTCNSKSKKLSSCFGGLETRECKNGHTFEKDRAFGGAIPATPLFKEF
jgi:hypothetical protein